MLCKGICLATDSIIMVFAPPLSRQPRNCKSALSMLRTFCFHHAGGVYIHRLRVCLIYERLYIVKQIVFQLLAFWLVNIPHTDFWPCPTPLLRAECGNCLTRSFRSIRIAFSTLQTMLYSAKTLCPLNYSCASIIIDGFSVDTSVLIKTTDYPTL